MDAMIRTFVQEQSHVTWDIKIRKHVDYNDSEPERPILRYETLDGLRQQYIVYRQNGNASLPPLPPL